MSSGHIQLSGAGIGCVSLVNAEMGYEFNPPLSYEPDVRVTGSAESDQDRVEVALLSQSSKRFIFKVTTHGRNGNQVCANSFVNWTAVPKSMVLAPEG